MAEETQNSEANPQSAKGGGSGGMLPALLVIVLMPLISFAMFKFLFMPMIKAEIPEEGMHPQVDPSSIEVHGDGGEPKYEYKFQKPVTVNLKGASQARFLRSEFTMMSANPDFAAVAEQREAAMRNVAIGVLGNLTLADMERESIMNIVRNQLIQGFDHVLQAPMVEEIYFSEWAVQ